MNINSIKAATRTQLLSLAGVTTAVVDRVYPFELASVMNPAYPCINILIPPGSTPGAFPLFPVDYGIIRMLLYAWTKDGYDLGHNIMDAVKNGLHMQKISANGVRAVPSLVGDAHEVYDDVSQVWGVITNWNVRAIRQ